MRTIVLATCPTWPELSPSGACLATALRTRGWELRTAAWNRDVAPFAGATAVVVRSTWDYHESPDAYRAWLGRLDPRRTFNPPDLIRWNLAKTHVLELGRRGVDGVFSHGLRRVPAPGEFRINPQYGGRREAAALGRRSSRRCARSSRCSRRARSIRARAV